MTTKAPLSEIISISDLAWQERQPGVRVKSLWEHPETRRRAVMARIEAEAKLPLHRHVGDELVFVIEGAIADDFGTVTAGNMGYRPDGCGAHRVELDWHDPARLRCLSAWPARHRR